MKNPGLSASERTTNTRKYFQQACLCFLSWKMWIIRLPKLPGKLPKLVPIRFLVTSEKYPNTKKKTKNKQTKNLHWVKLEHCGNCNRQSSNPAWKARAPSSGAGISPLPQAPHGWARSRQRSHVQAALGPKEGARKNASLALWWRHWQSYTSRF